MAHGKLLLMRRLNKFISLFYPLCLSLILIFSGTGLRASEAGGVEPEVVEPVAIEPVNSKPVNSEPVNVDISPEEQLVLLLSSLESLDADFRQHTARGEVQIGHVWLSKPNQFRLESEAPLSQTIVSDGETLWTHDRDLEQVIVSDMGDRASEIPILVFAGEPERLAEQYRIERFEDGQRDYFLLTPLGEGALTANLSLTFEQGVPLRLTLENAMGQQTSIDLLNVKRQPVNQSMFAFKIPADVDVIDDRVASLVTTENSSITTP